MKLMKKDIRPNEVITTFFALESLQLRVSKDKRQFLCLKLSDRTGNINGYLWDNAADVAGQIPEKSLVKVRGISKVINDSLSLQIERIRPANNEETDIRDFLDVVPGGLELWHEKLVSLSALIMDKNCRGLIDSFLSDDMFMQSFLTAPGGISVHHNYIGGLLEHTVSTMEQASFIVNDNAWTIDKDLLMTGAFLHDIGKTKELCWVPIKEYTTEGGLLGHIAIGMLMLEKKIAGILDFPEELAMLLRHIVLSHHGKREYGSPVLPATPEAIVLNLIEGTDAKINHLYRHIVSSESKSDWSGYDKFLNTAIYQKKFPRTVTHKLSEVA
jgi:3'-5' exoribonuclease